MNRLTLQISRSRATAVYAALVCFLTYSAVYAFRKPFTVGFYESAAPVFGIGYKSMLIIAQVLGYTASKFYGIRFIGALQKQHRGQTILWLAVIAWLSLLLFAITPAPANIVFLFTNGFPLGLIWGIVFSYAEGRRSTDFIGAVLAVSFIFSSGFVKTIAAYFRESGQVTDEWLPFVTGAVFIVPLILLVGLLNRVPEPDAEDIERRSERTPLNAQQRKKLLRQFLPGMLLLIGVYVLLTIFRDIRDNFAADMWREAGYAGSPDKFVATEIPITLTVLALTAAMMAVKKNFTAFRYALYLVAAGLVVAGGSTLLYLSGHISFFLWMTGAGLGLYMSYIPYNCILFERMIATFRVTGNVGFFMYVADACGYLGSVGVTVAKNLLGVKTNWIVFYTRSVVALSLIGLLAMAGAVIYFHNKNKKMVYG